MQNSAPAGVESPINGVVVRVRFLVEDNIQAGDAPVNVRVIRTVGDPSQLLRTGAGTAPAVIPDLDGIHERPFACRLRSATA